MTVSVASKLIQGRSGLSDLGALALAFIDGGVEWLAWAVGDPAASYAFPDETALVAQVQQGLHASPLTLLPGLKLVVSPVKLMTFSLSDLRTLAKAEGGADDAATAAQVAAILAAHGIVTQDGFTAVGAFLARLGVGGAALFQCLGLDDQIAINELITLPPPQGGQPDISGDAAAFAVQQARTPREFADYYRSYLAQIDKLKAVDGSSEQRQAAAAAAVQTLLPLMFGALDCPQVAGLVPPAAVATAVGDWLRYGRRVGFSRLSEGVCRIIDSTTFTTETGAAAQQVVNLYLANAQSFLSANAPRTGRVGQDGRSCVFPIQSGSLYAELLLGAAGTITLRQFRRVPPAAESS